MTVPILKSQKNLIRAVEWIEEERRIAGDGFFENMANALFLKQVAGPGGGFAVAVHAFDVDLVPIAGVCC